MTPPDKPTPSALYAGSFDPFTRGHADIVERTLAAGFVHVYIVVGYNINKRTTHPLEERIERLKTLYAEDPRITVLASDQIIAPLAQKLGCSTLIRGIRTVSDMEYERQIADVNLSHFGVDTLFFFTRPALACVSSSVVRELEAFGEDVSAYLP